MFHVKHSPIQHSPARVWRTLNDLADVGRDGLNRKQADKLGDTATGLRPDHDVRAARSHMDSQPIATVPAAQPAGHLGCHAPFPDEYPTVRRPERTTTTEQVNGLEQRGLAAAVLASDDIEARAELQLRRFEAAEAGKRQI
jgi:hypothetical protein